jgi:DNA-binding MarR family transcriptional regulator
MFLLSRLSSDTSIVTTSLIMLVLGLGLGFVMQVLVIAVQNSVDYKDLGVATSGVTLFRLIGGSLGAAILGAILATRLTSNLGHLLPAGAETTLQGANVNPQEFVQLSPTLRAAYIHAFTQALHSAFSFATVIGLFGFVLTWLLPEHPLRKTIAAATEGDVGGDVGHAFAMPTGTDPLIHVQRGLAILANRDERRRYVERIVKRANVDLSPAAAWLLGRVEKNAQLDLKKLSREHRVDVEIVDSALRELLAKRLIVEKYSQEKKTPTRGLTEEGCRVFNKLVAARREHLAELWPEWSPEKREEVADLMRRLARQLVPETIGP